MTVDEIVSKLRAAAERSHERRHIPDRHIDIEDELPEPSLQDLCQECRDFGSCGPPCDLCGSPVKHRGSIGWRHQHGIPSSFAWHTARPQQVYDCACCDEAFYSNGEPDRLVINGEPLYVCPTCSRLEGDDA